MSARSDDHSRSPQLAHALGELKSHFAQELNASPVKREAIEQLERILEVPLLAANMAELPQMNSIIEVDDGALWCKCLVLFENTFLCRCTKAGGTEYAVVEYFPLHGTNEIWTRGSEASEVLRLFTQEQRYALESWVSDLSDQMRAFVSANFPVLDPNFVTDDLIYRLQ